MATQRSRAVLALLAGSALGKGIEPSWEQPRSPRRFLTPPAAPNPPDPADHRQGYESDGRKHAKAKSECAGAIFDRAERGGQQESAKAAGGPHDAGHDTH